MTSYKPFTYECDSDNIFKIEGSFQSGTELAKFKTLIESLIDSGIDFNIDLTNVEYADSDAFEFIYWLDDSITTNIYWWKSDSWVDRRYSDYCTRIDSVLYKKQYRFDE